MVFYSSLTSCLDVTQMQQDTRRFKISTIFKGGDNFFSKLLKDIGPYLHSKNTSRLIDWGTALQDILPTLNVHMLGRFFLLCISQTFDRS